MSKLRVAFAASLLALLLAAAPAEAAKLRVGLYDCTGTYSGLVASVRILAGGDYLYAVERKDKKLVNPTKGRYAATGDRVKWLSGTFKRANYTSTFYRTSSSPNGYFSLDRKSNGTWTGISCYWKFR